MDRTFDEVAAGALPAMLRYATVLTGDREQAQDLVQDVLVTALVKWPLVSRAANVDAYLTRMLTNAYLTGRRIRSRRIHAAACLSPSAQNLGSASTAVVDDRAELIDRLARLPIRQRAALVLRYYLGYPDKESAHMLGCTEGSFRSMCSRALAALRLDVSSSQTVGLSRPHGGNPRD